MNKLVLIIAATLLAAPAALAGHGQLDDSWNINYAFNPMGFTFFQQVDWIGLGGPGTTPGGALDGPTPDDCMDSDGSGQTVYGNFHFAFPSIAQKVIRQDDEVLVPGQSVPAPQALVDLCTAAREVLFGQEGDHTYVNDPQQVGFGDVTSFADTFVLPLGLFDAALVAEPLTLEARLCALTLPVSFSSDGSEVWATFGFANGVISGQASSCEDITDGFLDNPELQDGATWNAGTINQYGSGVGASAYDINLHDLHDDGTTEVPFGLHAMCLRSSVVDANNAAAGFYEDYSYFWVDGPDNNYGLATSWVDPGATDGGATGQDCSSIGIAL